MELNLEIQGKEHTVRSYEPGRVQIGEQVFTDNLIVTPNDITHPWRVTDPRSLCVNDVQQLLDMQPQLVLLGLGENYQYPNASFLAEFLKRKIGIEIMTTQAACRTYNLLAGEGRFVAAGLLI